MLKYLFYTNFTQFYTHFTIYVQQSVDIVIIIVENAEKLLQNLQKGSTLQSVI